MRFPISITHNFLLEPMLHVFGVKRESSYVEIGAETLDVRMGVWFHETFPLAQVASMAPSDWPWWGGLGVKLCPNHGVGVVGANEGIVNVKLKSAVKTKVLVTVDCEQLWLSLEDADGFMRALSEAAHVPISAHVPFWGSADPSKKQA